jgi:SPP1 family predicted phage head-tail adaptor
MKFDRRHSITLQNKVSTQNEVGTRNEQFVNIATFRAAYVPTQGRQYVSADSIHTETDCEFQVAYSMSSPSIQPDMYVLHSNTGILYLIKAVLDVGGLHRELRILCVRER